MMEPANTVIKICGGPRVVADMVKRSYSRVLRWTYSRERGGTGGLIPADIQQALLDEALVRDIDLQPQHFFRTESAAREPVSGGKAEDAA